MVRNQLLRSSRITPSTLDWLYQPGSVLCRSMCCFLTCSMNVVPRFVCSLLPSQMIWSGTPKSAMNCFKASPASPLTPLGKLPRNGSQWRRLGLICSRRGTCVARPLRQYILCSESEAFRTCCLPCIFGPMAVGRNVEFVVLCF